MTLRMNVRNLLVGANFREVAVELAIAIERGDTARAGFIREWQSELDDEFDHCSGLNYDLPFTD